MHGIQSPYVYVGGLLTSFDLHLEMETFIQSIFCIDANPKFGMLQVVCVNCRVVLDTMDPPPHFLRERNVSTWMQIYVSK